MCSHLDHDRIRDDMPTFRALPLAGHGLMDDGEGGYLELRNCVCGSTLALPIVTIAQPAGEAE